MDRAAAGAPDRAAVLITVLLAVVAVLAPAPANAEISGSAVRAQQAGLIDVGLSHACAILTAGEVRCWGLNTAGQLGQGDTAPIGDNEHPDAAAAVRLGAGRRAVQIALGSSHTCALLDDGTVRCWGLNTVGQLGQANTAPVGDDETPDAVPPVSLGGRAVAISAGGDNTCAVLDGGTARCWGPDTYGQLGTAGDALTTIGDDETPAQGLKLGVDLPVQTIAMSTTHACALLQGGRVGCWGQGSFNALGYGNADTIGDDEDPQDAGYVNLGTGRTATAISTGGYDSCAILDDASATCWGYGQYGRQGRGDENSVPNPALVPPLDLGVGARVQAIAAGGVMTGYAHACVILGDGSLRCWGRNPSGQLGYGNLTDIGDTAGETAASGGPVDIGAGRTAVATAAGGTSSCALLDDGTLRCWGLNSSGQLGIASIASVGDDELPGSVPPVRLGGALTGGLGDASLTLAIDAAQRTVGQDVRLTATLRSSGLDAVGAPAVQLSLPAGLALVTAAPSAGTFAGGTWTLPSVPTGTDATLTVIARVGAPGPQTAAAELTATAASFTDADSTPGNGVATEDDQASATVTGVAEPVATGTSAPQLTALSLSRRTFAVGRGPTAVSATARGTTARFVLSGPASVRFTVTRRLPGRRSGNRCVAVGRTRPSARRRCTRTVTVGTLRRSGLAAGARTLAFSGRIGRRALRPGRYSLVLLPTGPTGLPGAARAIGFRVVAR